MADKKRKATEIDAEIEGLQAEMTEIRKHPEFARQLQDIERAKETTLAETEKSKKLQIDNLTALHEYEQKVGRPNSFCSGAYSSCAGSERNL